MPNLRPSRYSDNESFSILPTKQTGESSSRLGASNKASVLSKEKADQLHDILFQQTINNFAVSSSSVDQSADEAIDQVNQQQQEMPEAIKQLNEQYNSLKAKMEQEGIQAESLGGLLDVALDLEDELENQEFDAQWLEAQKPLNFDRQFFQQAFKTKGCLQVGMKLCQSGKLEKHSHKLVELFVELFKEFTFDTYNYLPILIESFINNKNHQTQTLILDLIDQLQDEPNPEEVPSIDQLLDRSQEVALQIKTRFEWLSQMLSHSFDEAVKQKVSTTFERLLGPVTSDADANWPLLMKHFKKTFNNAASQDTQLIVLNLIDKLGDQQQSSIDNINYKLDLWTQLYSYSLNNDIKQRVLTFIGKLKDECLLTEAHDAQAHQQKLKQLMLIWDRINSLPKNNDTDAFIKQLSLSISSNLKPLLDGYLDQYVSLKQELSEQQRPQVDLILRLFKIALLIKQTELYLQSEVQLDENPLTDNYDLYSRVAFSTNHWWQFLEALDEFPQQMPQLVVFFSELIKCSDFQDNKSLNLEYLTNRLHKSEHDNIHQLVLHLIEKALNNELVDSQVGKLHPKMINDKLNLLAQVYASINHYRLNKSLSDASLRNRRRLNETITYQVSVLTQTLRQDIHDYWDENQPTERLSPVIGDLVEQLGKMQFAGVDRDDLYKLLQVSLNHLKTLAKQDELFTESQAQLVTQLKYNCLKLQKYFPDEFNTTLIRYLAVLYSHYEENSHSRVEIEQNIDQLLLERLNKGWDESTQDTLEVYRRLHQFKFPGSSSYWAQQVAFQNWDQDRHLHDIYNAGESNKADLLAWMQQEVERCNEHGYGDGDGDLTYFKARWRLSALLNCGRFQHLIIQEPESVLEVSELLSQQLRENVGRSAYLHQLANFSNECFKHIFSQADGVDSEQSQHNKNRLINAIENNTAMTQFIVESNTICKSKYYHYISLLDCLASPSTKHKALYEYTQSFKEKPQFLAELINLMIDRGGADNKQKSQVAENVAKLLNANREILSSESASVHRLISKAIKFVSNDPKSHQYLVSFLKDKRIKDLDNIDHCDQVVKQHVHFKQQQQNEQYSTVLDSILATPVDKCESGWVSRYVDAMIRHFNHDQDSIIRVQKFINANILVLAKDPEAISHIIHSVVDNISEPRFVVFLLSTVFQKTEQLNPVYPIVKSEALKTILRDLDYGIPIISKLSEINNEEARKKFLDIFLKDDSNNPILTDVLLSNPHHIGNFLTTLYTQDNLKEYREQKRLTKYLNVQPGIAKNSIAQGDIEEIDGVQCQHSIEENVRQPLRRKLAQSRSIRSQQQHDEQGREAADQQILIGIESLLYHKTLRSYYHRAEEPVLSQIDTDAVKRAYDLNHYLATENEDYVNVKNIAQTIEGLLEARQNLMRHQSQCSRKAFKLAQRDIDKQLERLFQKRKLLSTKTKSVEKLVQEDEGQHAAQVINALVTKLDDPKLRCKYLSLFLKKGYFNDRLNQLLQFNEFKKTYHKLMRDHPDALRTFNDKRLQKEAKPYQEQLSEQLDASQIGLEDLKAFFDKININIETPDQFNNDLRQRLFNKLQELTNSENSETHIVFKHFCYQYQKQLQVLGVGDLPTLLENTSLEAINARFDRFNQYLRSQDNVIYDRAALLYDDEFREYAQLVLYRDCSETDVGPMYLSEYAQLQQNIKEATDALDQHQMDDFFESYFLAVKRFRMFDRNSSLHDYKPLGDLMEHFEKTSGLDSWHQLMFYVTNLIDSECEYSYDKAYRILNDNDIGSPISSLKQLYNYVAKGNGNHSNRHSFAIYNETFSKLLKQLDQQSLQDEEVYDLVHNSLKWLVGQEPRGLHGAFYEYETQAAHQYIDRVVDVICQCLDKVSSDYQEQLLEPLKSLIKSEANEPFIEALSSQQITNMLNKLEGQLNNTSLIHGVQTCFETYNSQFIVKDDVSTNSYGEPPNKSDDSEVHTSNADEQSDKTDENNINQRPQSDNEPGYLSQLWNTFTNNKFVANKENEKNSEDKRITM